MAEDAWLSKGSNITYSHCFKMMNTRYIQRTIPQKVFLSKGWCTKEFYKEDHVAKSSEDRQNGYIHSEQCVQFIIQSNEQANSQSSQFVFKTAIRAQLTVAISAT